MRSIICYLTTLYQLQTLYVEWCERMINLRVWWKKYSSFQGTLLTFTWLKIPWKVKMMAVCVLTKIQTTQWTQIWSLTAWVSLLVRASHTDADTVYYTCTHWVLFHSYRARWLREIGFVGREYKRWYHQKPKCADNSQGFVSVRIQDFYPALVVLAYGILFSVAILFLEVFYNKIHLRCCQADKKAPPPTRSQQNIIAVKYKHQRWLNWVISQQTRVYWGLRSSPHKWWNCDWRGSRPARNLGLGPAILKRCTRSRMMCLSNWEKILLSLIKCLSYKSTRNKNVSFYCICIIFSWSTQFLVTPKQSNHCRAHCMPSILLRPFACTRRWKQMLVHWNGRLSDQQETWNKIKPLYCTLNSLLPCDYTIEMLQEPARSIARDVRSLLKPQFQMCQGRRRIKSNGISPPPKNLSIRYFFIQSVASFGDKSLRLLLPRTAARRWMGWRGLRKRNRDKCKIVNMPKHHDMTAYRRT
jgi:hypothetical protein